MSIGKRRVILFGTTFLASFGLVSGASAQEAAAKSAAEGNAIVEEIIVTARKRAETLLDAPVAITALRGEELDARGATSLAQISALTPGLVAAPTPLMDSYYIRGIGSQPQNPGFEQSVGLFIDGVYYGVGRWGSQGYVDLESAEVLRGPQSTFFGKSTIAGAINLRTKNPGRDFEGYVRAGYEINARQGTLQGVISGPITETLRARVVAKVSRGAGWYDTVAGGRVPTTREYFGRTTFVWEPTGNFNVRFIAAYDDTKNDFAGSTLYRCAGPGNTASPNPNFGPDPQPCGREFFVTEPQVTKFGKSGLKYSSYAYTLEANLDTAVGTITSVTGLNKADSYVLFASNVTFANATSALSDLDNKAFSEELRFSSTLDSPINFVVGGYYQETDFFSQVRAYVLPDRIQGTVNGQSVFTFTKPSTQDGTSKSVFGEISWDILDTLTLDAGGRYTHETKKSFMRNVQTAPNLSFLLPPTYSASQSFSDFSPSATLTWKPTRDHTIFGSYKTGFKSGGFSHGQTIFFFPPAQPPALGAVLFGKESVKGFEVGSKGEWANRRLRLELLGYNYEYSDLQVNAYNAAINAFTVQNAGRVRSKGIEFATTFAATSELTLSGALNYTHTRFTQFNAACNSVQVRGVAPCNVPLGATFGQDLRGAPTPLAPDWSGRADASYRADVGDYGLTVAGGIQFSSRYNLQSDGRRDNSQPAYQRYDARLVLEPENERWELALIGTNLTDEQVAVFAAERSQSPADIAATLDRGRQVEVRGTLRF
ncbi:MAG: TonB-dependent receptor [Sphingomonadaceae bacterium]|nr:TonB-dependent receptor [Sphingomonadaceae bacterium]